MASVSVWKIEVPDSRSTLQSDGEQTYCILCMLAMYALRRFLFQRVEFLRSSKVAATLLLAPSPTRYHAARPSNSSHRKCFRPGPDRAPSRGRERRPRIEQWSATASFNRIGACAAARQCSGADVRAAKGRQTTRRSEKSPVLNQTRYVKCACVYIWAAVQTNTHGGELQCGWSLSLNPKA